MPDPDVRPTPLMSFEDRLVGGTGPSECKYSDIPPEIYELHGVYVDFVEQGNTSLLDLPVWVREVARLARYWQNRRQAEDIRDRSEKQKSRDVLDKAGIPT